MQHERLRPEEASEQDYDEDDKEQRELEEEDQSQHRSVIQYSRAVDLWKHLFDSDLTRTMNQVTRAVPRDPYAGLLNVHGRIWSHCKVARVALQLCMIGLNFVYVTISFLYVWTHQINFLHHDSNSQLSITKSGAVACVRTANMEDQQCIHTNLRRYYQHLILTAAEFIVILPMICAFFVLSGLFLCGGSRTNHLPSKHPWFFFFAPSAILSLSTLQFFQLWHPARITSLWCLNERKFWRLIFYYSIFGPDQESFDASHSREYSISPSQESSTLGSDASRQGQQQPTERHFHWKMVEVIVGICFHVFMVVCTFQGALLKLSSIYFAAIINFSEWTLKEWILVLGFVNQAVTAINPNTIEVHRLLLLMFGGADGYWTKRKCSTAHQFFSLVAHKICFGKIGDEGLCCFKRAPMPLAPLTAMWTFTSHDLQNLVFCPLREKRLEDGTPLRAAILDQVWEQSYCSTFVEKLKEAHRDDGPSRDNTKLVLKIEKERLSVIRDSLVHRVLTAGLDGDEEKQAPASVRLLIASEIQNSIEDLDEICEPSPPEKEHFFHTFL